MAEIINRPTMQNRILAALPTADYNRLLPYLEPVKLVQGEILYREGDPIAHVYFPDNAMISLTTTTDEGHGIEIGIIGREGMSGTGTLLGVDFSPNQVVIQLPNNGLKIKTDVIKAEFHRGGALQMLSLRYLHGLITQISQTAICNRLHTIEQRLSRWLLMCRDRYDSDNLPLTQDFLSIMLGVNRPSLTVAAIALQNTGLIRYRRGVIKILNRAGLEDFTCECYGKVKIEDDRFPL